jgi:hypothetical protein
MLEPLYVKENYHCYPRVPTFNLKKIKRMRLFTEYFYVFISTILIMFFVDCFCGNEVLNDFLTIIIALTNVCFSDWNFNFEGAKIPYEKNIEVIN